MCLSVGWILGTGPAQLSEWGLLTAWGSTPSLALSSWLLAGARGGGPVILIIVSKKKTLYHPFTINRQHAVWLYGAVFRMR